MKATLKDIAEDANVSTASVSLVLNNKGNISDETRERIIASMKKLNYKKMPQARSKEGPVGKTIKFLRIAKHGHVVNRNHDVFIADYLDGLTQGAHQYRLKLEVSSYTWSSTEDVLHTILHGDGVDGAVILATELSEEDMKHFTSADIPLVFIDNYNEFLPFDYVDMDNSSAIHMVYDYVRQKGYEDIGFISGCPDTWNLKLREEAYRKSVDRDGKKPNVITIDSTFDGAYNDMKKYVSESRSDLLPAYVCANDIMALGAMRALVESGIKVPEDVALIGFDNLPQAAQSSPPLSSVEVSKRKIAKFAVQALYERMNTPELPQLRILVGGKLVERESL